MKTTFLHNYHSHTSRCGHAHGTDEGYVKAAIEAGFKTIGFSDHVILPGVLQPYMRARYALLEDYIDSVNYLKKKYKKIIDVKLGFECEYLQEPFDSYYRELLEKRGFDYLILGQHCFFDHDYGEMKWYSDIPSKIDRLHHYEKDIIDGMESGLFAYVAHPDLYVLFNDGWDDNCVEIAHHICQAAERLHIPLELNMGRTRGKDRRLLWRLDNNIYPYPTFWEIAKGYDIEVVIGVDAHRPEHYENSDYEAFAEILRNLGMKFKEKLEI